MSINVAGAKSAVRAAHAAFGYKTMPFGSDDLSDILIEHFSPFIDGSLGGNDTIETLLDTEIGVKSDGDILSYDSATSKWVNIPNIAHDPVTVSGAPLTLSDQEITFNYDTGQFQLDGNNLQVKESGISHNGLADLQLAQSGVTYGHIDDQAQAIYGAKTWSGNAVFNGTLDIGITDTTVLYSNAGVLTGSTDFTWDNTAKTLTLSSALSEHGLIVDNTGGGDSFFDLRSNGVSEAKLYTDGASCITNVAGVKRVQISPSGTHFGAVAIYQVVDNYGLQIYGYDDRVTDRFDFGINVNGWLLANSTKYQSWMVGGVAYMLGGYLGAYFYQGLNVADNYPVWFGAQDFSLGHRTATDDLVLTDGSSLTSSVRMRMNNAGLFNFGGDYVGTRNITAGVASGNPGYGWSIAGSEKMSMYVDNSASDIGVIDAPNNLKVTNGNVGIGTAPISKLNVYSSTTSCNLYVQNSATGNNIADGFAIMLGADKVSSIWNWENANMVFGTNNTRAMTIDNAQKVGIGVVPLTNMSAGDMVLEGGSLVLKEIATPTADANYGKIYTKTDNKLYFQDGAGTEHEIAFV